jgi:hypothetical protein
VKIRSLSFSWGVSCMGALGWLRFVLKIPLGFWVLGNFYGFVRFVLGSQGSVGGFFGVGDCLFWDGLSFLLDGCLLLAGFKGEAFGCGFIEGVGRLSAECFAPRILGGVAIWGYVYWVCNLSCFHDRGLFIMYFWICDRAKLFGMIRS